jgi:peptidoglycan/LPS O-acetylase OafA/YrhL
MGFVLFTSAKVIDAVATHRRLYVWQTAIFTALMFAFWIFRIDMPGAGYVYSAAEITIAFSCGLSAIGYCKRYFNKDHKYRKTLNEAIYPFYLLHQPLIILVGYIILKWQLPTYVNVVLITLVSLVLTIAVYGLIVKRSNLLRVAFGMKKKAPKKALVPQNSFVNSQKAKLQPVPQVVSKLEHHNEVI